MDKVEIMLMKTLLMEELKRLEYKLSKSTSTLEYMRNKELHNKYSIILSKM